MKRYRKRSHDTWPVSTGKHSFAHLLQLALSRGGVRIAVGARRIDRLQELEKQIVKKREISEINIDAIQEVANDIGIILKMTADIRGSNARIRSSFEKIEEGLDGIRISLKDYQHKLRSATGGES